MEHTPKTLLILSFLPIFLFICSKETSQGAEETIVFRDNAKTEETIATNGNAETECTIEAYEKMLGIEGNTDLCLEFEENIRLRIAREQPPQITSTFLLRSPDQRILNIADDTIVKDDSTGLVLLPDMCGFLRGNGEKFKEPNPGYSFPYRKENAFVTVYVYEARGKSLEEIAEAELASIRRLNDIQEDEVRLALYGIIRANTNIPLLRQLTQENRKNLSIDVEEKAAVKLPESHIEYRRLDVTLLKKSNKDDVLAIDSTVLLLRNDWVVKLQITTLANSLAKHSASIRQFLDAIDANLKANPGNGKGIYSRKVLEEVAEFWNK